jgi:hypothetical protein
MPCSETIFTLFIGGKGRDAASRTGIVVLPFPRTPFADTLGG